MDIKLNLLKEIKSPEVFKLINKYLKLKKICLFNKSFAIGRKKIPIKSCSIDSKILFLNNFTNKENP